MHDSWLPHAEYAFIRRSTLSRLRWANPDVEPRLVLACAQKLLDRILFIAFCEDRGLLPAETIKRAYKHRDPYNPRPLWENFRGMFRAIDIGSDELDIRKYNGGLFADDPVLDHLKVPDDVFGMFDGLAEYDFRPASAIPADEVVTDRRLVDVEILGHIFEQSIDDLEKLQAELEQPVEIAADQARDWARLGSPFPSGERALIQRRGWRRVRDRLECNVGGNLSLAHRIQCPCRRS